ncbi:MAG TPA: oxaloacetate decarboxylase [Burkholderiaceae bacterium]|nr:oxaloacetate decarboxylase [Burkholderiaceae bacterium]
MTDSPNQRLRRLVVPGAGVILPGAGNALAARFIVAAGFDAVFVSGAAVANSFLGMPDIGLTSVTELVDHVAAIRDAVDVPIVVDADTGFGNAINVQRTVRALERAGANSIMLEDQTSPKRCGHFDGKDVVPAAVMVSKIRAACDARGDAGLMILARTDARAVEGLQGALDRANRYREAGADWLFVEAPRSVEELAAIPAGVPGPHLCNLVIGGKTPLRPREELAAMGYAGIGYAKAALQASMMAMRRVLGHLHAHGSIEGAEDMLMMFEERQRMLDHDRFKALEKRYAAD